MYGFSGPFDYNVDGTIYSWDNLDDYIKEELIASKFTKENSSIYLCKVCVFKSEIPKQKNHDWAKVKRIFFNITVPNKSMHIVGIHPTNSKVTSSSDLELPIIQGVKSKITLFKMLRFELSLDGVVKLFSRKDRYSILANFNSRMAQWVFSERWENLDFSLYVYIAVPNAIADKDKYIEMSVKSVRRKNKVLNNLTVWKRKVDFMNINDLCKG